MNNHKYKCRPNTKSKYGSLIRAKLSNNCNRFSSKKITNNKEINNNFGVKNKSSSKKRNCDNGNQLKIIKGSNFERKIKNKNNILNDNLKINLKSNLKSGIFMHLLNSNFKKNNNKHAKKIEVSGEKQTDYNFNTRILNSSNSKRSLLVNTKKTNKSFANINPIKNNSKNKNDRNQSNPFKEQKTIPVKFKNSNNENNNNTSKKNIIINDGNNNNVLSLNVARALKESFLKNKSQIVGIEKINSKNHKTKRKSRNIQDPYFAFKSTGSIEGTTFDANNTNTNTYSNTNIYITYNNVKKYRKPFQSVNYLNNSESSSKYNKKLEMNTNYKTNKILSRNFTSSCYIGSSNKYKTGVYEKNKKSGITCKVVKLIFNNNCKALENNTKKEKNRTIVKMEKNKKIGIISGGAIKCTNKMKK